MALTTLLRGHKKQITGHTPIHVHVLWDSYDN